MKDKSKEVGLALLAMVIGLWAVHRAREKSVSRENAFEEQSDVVQGVGAIPHGYIRLGKLDSKLTGEINKEKVLSYKAKPGPIVITDLLIRHIKDKHKEEPAFASNRNLLLFVKNVVENYNQIWLGSDDSILLVADGVNEHNHQVYHIVALQMTDMVDDQGKVCWNIHTAQSRKSRSGKNLLLWKKC